MRAAVQPVYTGIPRDISPSDLRLQHPLPLEFQNLGDLRYAVWWQDIDLVGLKGTGDRVGDRELYFDIAIKRYKIQDGQRTWNYGSPLHIVHRMMKLKPLYPVERWALLKVVKPEQLMHVVLNPDVFRIQGMGATPGIPGINRVIQIKLLFSHVGHNGEGLYHAPDEDICRWYYAREDGFVGKLDTPVRARL